MKTSLSLENLVDYVQGQTNVFFPDRHPVSSADLMKGGADALHRLEHCFLRSRVPRYCVAQSAIFNHLYSDQYLMFLWFLSNSLWRNKADDNVLNKLYLLNKCLHAFDCAFDTALPDVFLVVHGAGTVLGKAVYSDYFVVYHGCTVGQSQGIYPRIGRGVGLGAGAALIGNCAIGEFASIGAGCTLVNHEIAAGTTVFRADNGTLTLRDTRAAIALQYFIEEEIFASNSPGGR